jgi:hypothetical protein
MTRSDFQCLALLSSSTRKEMTQTDVYKGCSALALNGGKHVEESSLPKHERTLLEARKPQDTTKLAGYDVSMQLLPSGDSYSLQILVQKPSSSARSLMVVPVAPADGRTYNLDLFAGADQISLKCDAEN